MQMTQPLLPYECLVTFDNLRSKMRAFEWCRLNIGQHGELWHSYAHWGESWRKDYPHKLVFGFATRQDQITFGLAWGG